MYGLVVSQMAEDWNDSRQSKEQIEARQQNKKEADMRRERSLAYAFSQQVLVFPLQTYRIILLWEFSLLNFNVFSACNANLEES